MRAFYFLVYLMALGLITARGAELTTESFSKVHKGMTSAQVQAILGQPKAKNTMDVGGIVIIVHIYESSSHSNVVIVFSDGKVMSKAMIIQE